MLGRADTSNGSEHDKSTGIELKWLAYSARRWISLEILPKDFIELLYPGHLEEVELDEHHIGIATTGLTQQCTEVSQGLMCLLVKRWQNLPRF